MDELFEKLVALSDEELEKVFATAQKILQDRRQEAERKKQEEIAKLQQRLRELQAEVRSDGFQSPAADTAPQNAPAAPAASTPQETKPGMVPCPHCHQLLPLGTKFCVYCGGDATPRPGSATPGQGFIACPTCHAQIPAGSRFCQECGRVL